MKNKLSQKRLRRRKHNRKKILGTTRRPRLSIYRSSKNIYVQIIDDETNKTLSSFSTLSVKEMRGKNNIENSSKVGREIAKKALELGINSVVFDRGHYAYHGKVKAIADAARETGLKI